ncbi:MAG TPA: thiamine phosphate synthase [Kofleriaceae bacterium]|nr:thiamine phosphate synthase [Kofleriaceae bacterium]
MSVRVVLITDRRLYGSEELAAQIARILRAVPRGTVAIQVREKDLDGGPLALLVREVLEVARPAGAPVWVNERLDVALATGSFGVHLPERGLPLEDALTACAASASAQIDHSFTDEESVEYDVRKAQSTREGLAIGCSRHSTNAVIDAATHGALLVQLGPIFATPSKGAPLGPEVLGVRTQLPEHVTLVAVGGIDTAERARQAAYAGADAVAVIRAAWRDDSPQLIAEMVEAVEAGIGMRMLS